MNVTLFNRAGVACAGVVVGLGFAAVPVIAKPVPNAGKARDGAHSSVIRPSGMAPVGTSQYLGGYDVKDTGNLTETSIVQVPKATCANLNDYEDLFLGELLVPAAGDAYQGGANDATSVVGIDCSGSASGPFYYAEADEVSGEEAFVSVQPGDLVETQVSDTYGGNTTATTTDLNSGDTATSSGASTGDDTQLYLGAEPDVSYEQAGPVVDYAIPKFTTAKFNDTIVNGTEWTTSQPTPYSLEQNSDVQIKTAPVPSTATYDFTLTEKHSK